MGSRPKRQKAGKMEKFQHAEGVRGMEEYNEKYRPLIERFNKESQRDFSDRLGGQGQVGAARAAGGAALGAALGNGPNVMSAGDITAQGQGGRNAGKAAQTEAMASAAGVSLGGMGQATTGLSQITGMQNQMQQAKMESKQMVRNAGLQALGTAVGAAGTAYGLNKLSQPATTRSLASNDVYRHRLMDASGNYL